MILPGTSAAGAAKLADALLGAARERPAEGRARTSVSIGPAARRRGRADAGRAAGRSRGRPVDPKVRGRDRVSVVGAGAAAPARMRAQMTWAGRIRTALEDDGFVLYEQPIVGVRSDRPSGRSC